MENLRRYLEFATETAYAAGRLTLGYYQRALDVQHKADDSPVTVADREAEALIRARVAAEYPEHGVMGEEEAETGAGASHRWIVDPIDGTKAFARGVPLYGVLLALEIEGQIEVGAAYFPALDEMLAAATGLGATWNGRPARVSDVSELSRATLCYTDVGSFTRYGRGAAFERLCERVYDRRGWSDAYGYALVATGRAELMLDPIMNAWDCGPFAVILKEAGGYFGDWQGRATIYGDEALAVNAGLKDEVMALIRGAGGTRSRGDTEQGCGGAEELGRESF